MNENMNLYNKVREVPEEAKKPITGGRLKGFTDINPQWRIQTLTELFGPCGFGWYIDPDTFEHWTEEAKNGEITANVKFDLYIKVDDQWSKPILGIGGSKLVSTDKNGSFVSDECFKMATTDAISVACKNLGFGADVYWSQGRTKYDTNVPAYPPRDEMLKVVKAHYPEGETLQKLLDTFKVKKIEDATDAQLIAVFNKYAK